MPLQDEAALLHPEGTLVSDPFRASPNHRAFFGVERTTHSENQQVDPMGTWDFPVANLGHFQLRTHDFNQILARMARTALEKSERNIPEHCQPLCLSLSSSGSGPLAQGPQIRDQHPAW